MSDFGDRATPTPAPGGGGAPTDRATPRRALEPGTILDTFARARSMSVTDVGSALGTAVKVQGTATAGPAGVLRAPLSGRECVWYRSVVLRQRRSRFRAGRGLPTLQPFPAFAPSDLPDYGARRREGLLQRPAGSDRTSDAAFGVTDGRAVVFVDPSVTDVDATVFGINQLVRVVRGRRLGPFRVLRGPFRPDELHTEWILPVGTPVLAVGTVGQDAVGRVALLPGTGVALVSTKPEDQIVSRNRTAAHPPVFLKRLVTAIVAIGVLLGIGVVLLVLFLTVLR